MSWQEMNAVERKVELASGTLALPGPREFGAIRGVRLVILFFIPGLGRIRQDNSRGKNLTIVKSATR
jgi:hypothetical protein